MTNKKVNNIKMKAFETAMDQVVAPEMFIIARLNVMGQRGSNDLQLDAMIETTQHLMTCGFNVTYANTTNGEIALLFDLHESSFGRKTNKFNSILASEGSAKLTQVTDELVVFDCRTVALPNKTLVIEYFNWRAAHSKTSLRAWSYWQTLPNGRREIVTIDNTEVIAAYDEAMMNI
jgi:tRNA(His) guanylyltransferase